MKHSRNYFIRYLSYIYILCGFWLQPCLASVALKTAGLSHVNNDHNKGTPLKRYYNSRSNSIGMFGFGWCTDFESRLVIHSAEKIVLHHCRKNLVVTMQSSPGTGGSYLSSHSDFSLSINKGSFLVREITGDTLTFNRQGQLQQVNLAGLHGLLIYQPNNDVIQQVRYGNGTAIQFFYDRLKQKVMQVHFTPDDTAVEYNYRGDNLRRVNFKDRPSMTYQFDSFHNLVSINKGRASILSAEYDNTKDQLTELSKRGHCPQSYSYFNQSSDALLVSIRQRCSLKMSSLTTVEYDRRTYLPRKFNKLRLQYDDLRRIQSVTLESGENLHFSYLSNQKFPHMIEQLGEGKIQLKYNYQGQIEGLVSINGNRKHVLQTLRRFLNFSEQLSQQLQL